MGVMPVSRGVFLWRQGPEKVENVKEVLPGGRVAW